jgi:circadian clock protein KaiB
LIIILYKNINGIISGVSYNFSRIIAGEHIIMSIRHISYQLQLFIADNEPNSLQAKANLEQICIRYLADNLYQLEVIDVLDNFQLALQQGILVTPTLLVISPPPLTIVVGTLNKIEPVLNAMKVVRTQL